MALSKNITMQNGLAVDAAYHKVSAVRVNSKTDMTFWLSVKKEADLPDISSQSFNCNYNIAGDNPIKQAYEHLKTLPEFAGAADV